MTDQQTVFLVDDDAAVRHAVQKCLEASGYRVASFRSSEEFLEKLQPEWQGCALLDIRMPGASGLDLQRTLLSKRVPLQIVFMTGHGDIHMCVKAIKAGAVDFLEKPFDQLDLLRAVREAIRQDSAEREIQARQAEILRRFERLTPREREVMTGVLTGEANKKIAARLGVSYRTIEIHRSRVLSKMEAGSSTELVTLAARAELLPEEN